MAQSAPRLFVESALAEAARVPLSEAQAHYLLTVMRRKAGDPVILFNGKDGEWLALIEEVGKRRASAQVSERRRLQTSELDLWLLFAPVKNARIEFIIEKATELGVAALMPVVTERTIVRRLNDERLRAHAIEAAEQSNRLSVPALWPIAPLSERLAAWPVGRHLIYADEIGPSPLARAALAKLPPGPCGLLIGPEGGFSLTERAEILKLDAAVAISLGPRLLRADTAALSALALVQGLIGDQ